MTAQASVGSTYGRNETKYMAMSNVMVTMVHLIVLFFIDVIFLLETEHVPLWC